MFSKSEYAEVQNYSGQHFVMFGRIKDLKKKDPLYEVNSGEFFVLFATSEI